MHRHTWWDCGDHSTPGAQTGPQGEEKSSCFYQQRADPQAVLTLGCSMTSVLKCSPGKGRSGKADVKPAKAAPPRSPAWVHPSASPPLCRSPCIAMREGGALPGCTPRHPHLSAGPSARPAQGDAPWPPSLLGHEVTTDCVHVSPYVRKPAHGGCCITPSRTEECTREETGATLPITHK